MNSPHPATHTPLVVVSTGNDLQPQSSVSVPTPKGVFGSSPQGRPLNYPRDENARFLCEIPLAELVLGKRVHSLNTNWRGEIVGHGEHRGDPTLDIDWDSGNKSVGVWHFVLDTVAESL